MIDLLLDAAPADRLLDAGERASVVQAAISAFRHHAFHEVGFDLVAEEAGLDAAAVRAHFPEWDGLILATIEVWNTQRMAPILPLAEQFGAVAFLRGIVLANLADPALMRLLTSMVNISATPQHPLAGALQQQWMRFHALVQRALIRDVQLGREPGTMEPARGAEQLIALYEGLQLQSMVRPGMRLLEAFDRAVSRMRRGWTEEYAAPVWEI